MQYPKCWRSIAFSKFTPKRSNIAIHSHLGRCRTKYLLSFFPQTNLFVSCGVARSVMKDNSGLAYNAEVHEQDLDYSMELGRRLKDYSITHFAHESNSQDHVLSNNEAKRNDNQKRPLLPMIESIDSTLNEMQDLKEIIKCQESELAEMASVDLNHSLISLKRSIKDAARLLLPDYAFDSQNAVIEVLPGAGGNEASIFAEEIFNLYVGYCKQHFEVNVISICKSQLGIHKASAFISGRGAFKHMKYECGVHRVQRVPKAATGNKSDRLQTSTCSVAVLPECGEDEWDQFPESDMKFDFIVSIFIWFK